MPDPARTSSSTYLPRGATPLVAALEARAASLADLPVEFLEDLQVVRYHPGEFYKEHYDFLPVTEDVVRWGQRILTVFVYLNDLPPGETGGGTRFPKLGTTIRPAVGTAVKWNNVKPDGTVDSRQGTLTTATRSCGGGG